MFHRLQNRIVELFHRCFLGPQHRCTAALLSSPMFTEMPITIFPG
jgi:hypothetical protein